MFAAKRYQLHVEDIKVISNSAKVPDLLISHQLLPCTLPISVVYQRDGWGLLLCFNYKVKMWNLVEQFLITLY